MLHAVIMAGGSGTRFWPQSTQKHPKQFLRLFGEETMLQATVSRIHQLIPPERIWVITNQQYVELAAEQLPDIPATNIIGEPIAKNTAPCVALAATLLQQQDEEATMVVLPADHLIADTNAFLSVLSSAAQKAEQADALVTIGIQPNRPETGYGYIQYDESTNQQVEGNTVHKVITFTEKPDLKTAEKFLEAGNFLWNSGMFIWQAATILKQFEKYLPTIYAETQKLDSKLPAAKLNDAIHTFYLNCSSISIDYGIMEKADTVHIIPGNFGWNDVGSWNALYELSDKDSQANAIRAQHAVIEDAQNNLIHSENGKLIALVGVDNLAVVETEEAILVCNLDKAQAVKQVVNQLDTHKETKKFL